MCDDARCVFLLIVVLGFLCRCRVSCTIKLLCEGDFPGTSVVTQLIEESTLPGRITYPHPSYVLKMIFRLSRWVGDVI